MLKWQEALDSLICSVLVGSQAKAAWPRIILVLFKIDVCVRRAHLFFADVARMRVLVHALCIIMARLP